MRLSLVPVLVLAGCGDPSPQERALRGLPAFCQDALPRVDAFLEAQQQPRGERYGGTVVVAGVGPLVDGMNALVSADYSAAQHQNFMNLMTLIQVDEDLEPRPYLARDWELNEEDGELTFHLRDDVRWHDGEPTTAHDVEFTYLRATDPETAFPNAAYWDHYVTGEEGVEVLDDHTIRFHLTPHAELLDPWRVTRIMPRHLLVDVPPAELRQHPFGTRCPVGNGPFVFRQHGEDGSWTFERNPAFPEGLGGPPYLERYVYRVIAEPTTLLTELLTGAVDVYIAPLPDQARRIQEAEHLELKAFEFRNYVFVAWNARRPQLEDHRVRRALTLGTNRREIIDALMAGYARIANAGVPPFHWAHDTTLRDSLQYDPAAARQLLEEAGWVDRTGDGIRENQEGLPLELSLKYNPGNQQRQDIAEIMQAQLRAVGVSVRPQAVEWSTLVDRITNPEVRDFEGVVLSWVPEFKVDDHDLFHSSKVDQPFHWSGIQHPELDLLLDTLQLVVDREEALPLWRQYQSLLVRIQPFTYFFFPQRLSGVNRRLEGVHMDARGEWVGVAGWWIPEDARRRVRP